MRQFFTIMILAVMALVPGSLLAGGGNGNGNGGGNSNCLSEVTATFSENFRTVYVTSTKELSNVVLQFSDGDEYKFDNLDVDPTHADSFSGIDEHLDKCITGVWIKSGCNNSGDGPGYGEYRINPDWAEICPSLVVQQPPIPPVRHQSTVFSGGFGLRTAGVYEQVTTSLELFPNPARLGSIIRIQGLDGESNLLNIISVTGEHVGTAVIGEEGTLELSQFDLRPGPYFLQMAAYDSVLRIVVQ